MSGGGHAHGLIRGREMRRITLVGAAVNLALVVMQLVVGILAHSQALVADALHTLSDLVSDGIVWFAVGKAASAPDREHPYGHGRFETAATLALGMLLTLVGVGIAWKAGERLLAGGAAPLPGVWALYAAALTMLAKEGMYWYTLRVARRVRSELLRANAWHHRSDALSSLVVLIGVGGAILGVAYMDGIAAAMVGAMIVKIGWDLAWGAMHELVDSGLDDDSVEAIRAVIRAVPGVRSVHLLRTRRQGQDAMVDVHVQVAPRLSVTEGHMIAMAVEERLKAEVEAITDVTVHIDPENDEQGPPCHGLPLRDAALQLLASRWADLTELPAHPQIQLHYLGGKIHVELFLPFKDGLTPAASRALRLELQGRLAGHVEFGQVHLHFTTAS